MSGVYINMRNKNALCTVSMLSAMIENKSQGYLDILKPFVLICLPTEIGALISPAEITEKLQSEYGFSGFPCGLTTKLLKKLSNERSSGNRYVTRKTDHKRTEYRVSRQFDSSDFIQTRDEMRDKINDVLKSLQQYLIKNNYIKSQVEIPELREMLIRFFEANGMTVVRDVEELGHITTQNSDSDSFAIARFILDEYEMKSLTYTYLCDITKGFLVYKAIYIVEEEGKTEINSKLRDVTFYFDCSLLLDVLGYDSEIDRRAILELVGLIRRSGGKVAVFQHTVDEAANLIEAFANNQHKRNDFRLDGLAKKNYTREMLLTLAGTVEDDLKRASQISVEDAPPFSDKQNYNNVLGETEIVEWLQNHRTGGEESTERFHYDAKSLLAIGMLRRGTRPKYIERAKAVLVTQDAWLAKCLDDLYRGLLKSEFQYTISDIDLVSLLWLREYDGSSKLPSDLLIANACAACEVTQDVINRAIEIADMLEASGEISTDQALLIRSHTDIKPVLAATVQNDVSLVTANTIDCAIQRYIGERTDQHIQTIREEEQSKARAAQKEFAERYRELKNQREEMERSLTKECDDLRRELKQRKSEGMRKRKTQFDKVNNSAHQKADCYEKRWNTFLSVGFALLISATVIVCAYWSFLCGQSGKSTWAAIIVDVLGIIGNVALLFPVRNRLKKWITNRANRIYQNEYSRLVEIIDSDDM